MESVCQNGFSSEVQNQPCKIDTVARVRRLRMGLLLMVDRERKVKRNDMGIIFNLVQRDKADLMHYSQKSGTPVKHKLGSFTFSQAKITQYVDMEECSPSRLHRVIVSDRKMRRVDPFFDQMYTDIRRAFTCPMQDSQNKKLAREALAKMRAYALRLKELREPAENEEEPSLEQSENEKQEEEKPLARAEMNKTHSEELDSFPRMVRAESIRKAYSNIISFLSETFPRKQSDESPVAAEKPYEPPATLASSTPPPTTIPAGEENKDNLADSSPLQLVRLSSYYARISEGTLTEEDEDDLKEKEVEINKS